MMNNKNNYLVNEKAPEGVADIKLDRLFTKVIWSNRPGPSITEYQNFEVIKGKAEIIQIMEEYNYPTTHEKTYLVIPKTNIVIIYIHGVDYEDGDYESYAIFTKEQGWGYFGEVPENINAREVTELTEQDYKDIIQQIPENSWEQKYLLTVRDSSRPGPSFDDRENFSILRGSVIEVEMDSNYNYPTENWTKYTLIGTELGTIVKIKRYFDYGIKQGSGESEELAIFTAKGWKTVTVYDF